MAFLPFAIHVVMPRQREFGEIDCALPPGPFRGDDGLTETVDYCAAARIGICELRKVRTRLIVRALSSGGSRHGKTVISEFDASDATSIEVCSGCDGVSSGKTRIGVGQFLMNSRGTLYRKSGCARHKLWKYLSIVSIDTSGRRARKSGSQLSVLCRYMTPGSSGRSPTVWWKTAATTRSGARCNSLPAKQPPMQYPMKKISRMPRWSIT